MEIEKDVKLYLVSWKCYNFYEDVVQNGRNGVQNSAKFPENCGLKSIRNQIDQEGRTNQIIWIFSVKMVCKNWEMVCKITQHELFCKWHFVCS